MIALQGLGPIKASLPPLSKDAPIKAENKRKRKADVTALVARKRCRIQRKRVKTVACRAMIQRT